MRDPDFEGLHGKAWRFVKPAATDDPRLGLEVGDAWLLDCPQAHPGWRHHLLICVSLEEREGVDPPKKQYPEAEYELMVWAIDPRKPVPDPDEWPMGRGDGWLLTPPDVVTQFHGCTKEQAGEIVTLAAKACVSGVLVPDSDFRESWRETISTTAKHWAEH